MICNFLGKKIIKEKLAWIRKYKTFEVK